MIVDTSALVCILRDEPRRYDVETALLSASVARISAGTLLETGIVIDSRLAPGQRRRLDDLITRTDIRTVPVDAEQVLAARQAYQEYGRGSGHPARLNFGDCFAYALARVTGEPLLYVGNDFVHTDLHSALSEPTTEAGLP